MTIADLKKYIYENHKIEEVLQRIGCHHIKYHSSLEKSFYSCANYNGDNPTAINVSDNEYLAVRNWTRQEFKNISDIITLVGYNKQFGFIESVKYLHDILGLKYDIDFSQKNNIIKNEKISDIFKKYKYEDSVDVVELKFLSEDILDDYSPLLHISWFKEGIAIWTAKKFGIAYSYRQKRVVIPLRHWLTGKLLGTNSRTVVDNYNEFGIKKFFITPTYPKSFNLYGLYENYDAIKKAGYVIVYESEKSVLKRDSLGDSTGVALSGHTLSDEQIRILVGLNVDIVISMDKDIRIEEVRHMCDKFYGIRNVYYTVDKNNILNEKDSIADASNQNFYKLFMDKVKYDDYEHKQYLNSLKIRRDYNV